MFRLSRIRGKVGYSSKAEHDFQRPEDFDPRTYATRADWQLGDQRGEARIWLSERIEWLVRRHLGGDAGTVEETDDGAVFTTPYGDSRQLISWVLGLGPRARILEPQELVDEADERIQLVIERHAQPIELAAPVKRREREEPEDDGKRESHIRPERFARLVTLAGILIEAARAGEKLELRELTGALQISETELRQDIDVLNVVNFGGGSYVLYAEVQGDMIEVDPEPYGDNFARPARLLPLEAKALAAAIDLVGEHLPEGSLSTRPREDRGRPGPRPGHRRPADHHRQGRRLGDRPRGVQRDQEPPAAGDRALQGGPGRVHRPDDRALPAAQRHRGLVRARLRDGQGRHALVPARPHPLGHRAEGEVRAARGHRARRAGLAHHRARCPPPSARGCGSHPSGRAGRARTAAWCRSWPTAR